MNLRRGSVLLACAALFAFRPQGLRGRRRKSRFSECQRRSGNTCTTLPGL
jgi:hypothetical protein